MSNVIPFKRPPSRRQGAQAPAPEARSQIRELCAVLDELRAAISPAIAGSQRAQSKLEHAIRLRQSEEAAQRVLQRSFTSALASANLADLEAARDAYIDLLTKHRSRQTEL
jgi:hypothetical protein